LIDCIGDAIFNLEVTRTALMSVYDRAGAGIAAITGAVFHLPDAAYPETEIAIKDKVSVKFRTRICCPRLSRARLIYRY